MKEGRLEGKNGRESNEKWRQVTGGGREGVSRRRTE